MRILGALACKSRLQILDCMQQEISDPGGISRELNRHRSTIEKHLRILLRADLVEKIPSLNGDGQLTRRYKMRDNATKLLSVL